LAYFRGVFIRGVLMEQDGASTNGGQKF